jgi:hypothetical protein
MVSDDEIFKFFAMRVNQTANDTDAGLKLFLPIFSAVLGGSIWLNNQLSGAPVPFAYVIVSDALIALLTVISCYMVWDNLDAWWIYLQHLTDITRNSTFPVPLPPTKLSGWFDYALIIAMAVTGA